MRFGLLLIGAAAMFGAACTSAGKPQAPPDVTSRAATEVTSSPSPVRPAATATSARGGGTSVEVTGIVGAVNARAGLIEIDRLSGADVRRVAVSSSTVLRQAGGGTTTLAQIRSSDRIVARGVLNDRGDTLDADEVTIQAVVPGRGAPGG
jgi:hypothetical protein